MTHQCKLYGGYGTTNCEINWDKVHIITRLKEQKIIKEILHGELSKINTSMDGKKLGREICIQQINQKAIAARISDARSIRQTLKNNLPGNPNLKQEQKPYYKYGNFTSNFVKENE